MTGDLPLETGVDPLPTVVNSRLLGRKAYTGLPQQEAGREARLLLSCA